MKGESRGGRVPKRRRAAAADSYSKSVFVNCPFDEAYRPVFRAIVFATQDCGFVARSALEVDDSSEVRIVKIARIIERCRLGIHDISRVELDEATGLPRFNMPLELGLFLGAKRFGNAKQKLKNCLILDAEKHRYQKFISDIAGQDIQHHSGSYREVIREVRDWLQNVKRTDGLRQPSAKAAQVIIPGARRILERFDQFRQDLSLLCEQSGHDESRLRYADLHRLIEEWQSNHGPSDPA